MNTVTKDNGFHHGHKSYTLRNKETGEVENRRSTHNYFLEKKERETEGLKKEFSSGDYGCTRMVLS